MPKTFLTFEKALTTSSDLVKSLGMFNWLSVLSASFTERAAMATL